MSNSEPEEITPTTSIAPGQPPTLNETGAYTPTQGGMSHAAPAAGDPLIGSTISRYRILHKLGEGGMGSVYLAEQSEPVKRQVALKLIRGGADSRTIIARFEAERQALAVMDHPHIARIYDGGTTPAQQPYFVMELVQGMPINDYCDQHRFTPRQRLELFVPICQAVQHAHQKGIIHRDLKPGNVLVTEVDGKPVPKVIDFGVAKATEQPLTDQSLGDTGAVVGTPTYMSPEQADPGSMDIDTRTDIYALGVMLYELLTGSTPIDARQFKRGALLEMLRMVREVDPPRPSTKLSTAEALPSIAANRNLEPKQLQALLRGDIDWIVMKAIEKERTLRYETANGLAADVQRYLSGEAVLAHPPSRWYLARKFVKRNRVQVVAAGLVVLALVAGLAVSLWQMNRAIEAEGIARTNEDKAIRLAALEKAANEKTQRQLAQIEKGVKLLAGMLKGLDPKAEEKGAPPLYEQLRDRVGKAADELELDSVGDLLSVARLQTLLGDTLRELGNPEKAIVVMEKARAVRERELGVEHPDTLTSLNNLALAYQAAGRFSQAVTLLEQVTQASTRHHGADDRDTLGSLANLAVSYEAAGKSSQAITLCEQVRDAQIKQLGIDHAETIITRNNLARMYQKAGRYAESLRLFEEILDTSIRKNGVNHFFTLQTQNNLAISHLSAGRITQAITLFEELHAAQLKKMGASSPYTLSTLNNLALAYRNVNRFADAISLLKDASDTLVKELGADHPQTLVTFYNLASAYLADGQHSKAISLYHQVRDAQLKNLGADHPDTFDTLIKLAEAYRHTGEQPKSIAILEKVHAAQVKKLGADHSDTLRTLSSLGFEYCLSGQISKAVKHLEQTRDGQVKHLGADHPDTQATLNHLAMAYSEANKIPQAITLLEQVYASQLKQRGSDHSITQATLNNLACAYQAAGRVPEAIPLFEKLLDTKGKIMGAGHPDNITTLNNLGMAYLTTGRLNEAVTTLEQVARGVEKLQFQHERAFHYISNTSTAYEALKKYDQAEAWRRKWLAFVKDRSGVESSLYSDALAGLGMNLLQQKKWSDAESTLQQCLAIREKKQPDAWRTFNTQSMLGGVQLGQKKYSAAEQNLLKGYEGMKQRESTMAARERSFLVDALDRLIQLYTETSKPDDVKKWQVEKDKFTQPGKTK